MSAPPLRVPSPEAVAAVRAMGERRMDPDEFEAYVRAPMSDAERAEILGAIDWFQRRYPTPAARLASARLAYARWARAMPRDR